MTDADASGDGGRRGLADARGATDSSVRWRAKLIAASLVFVAAFGVRVLVWQDTRLEVGKVQTAVTANYRTYARHLREGGVSSFVRRDSPLADPDTLGHPPGYPVLLALVSTAFGERDAAIQFVQIVCDALAAVVLFLLVAELLSFGAGAAAGALAALSPQFAWNSVLLLPDTLAVLPLLAAVCCVARATRRGRDTRGGGDGQPARLALLFAAGALVGVSCWLRANALLLAPFLAAAVFVLSERAGRLRRACAVLCGALVVTGALTARNAYVFRRLIPVSLGAGQTLLEGIADYDPAGRFSIPQTDLGIMREEAARHQRPDYAETLFGPDAHARDRARLARGFDAIKSEPVWFAGVMARRAASMLRLERARLVSADPPVTHTPDHEFGEPVWTSGAVQLRVADPASPDAQLSAGHRWPRVAGDDTRGGGLASSTTFPVRAGTDYVLVWQLQVEEGRVAVGVERDGGAARLASTVIDAAEGLAPGAQPVRHVRLTFVSAGDGRARAVLANEGPRPVVQVGDVELYELGPASQIWTRYPRAVVRALQRLFLTATVLPLAFAGLLLAARSRDWRALVLLLVVPAYYMSVQSAVHTEYRYVLAVPHFLFALSAVALARGAGALISKIRAR